MTELTLSAVFLTAIYFKILSNNKSTRRNTSVQTLTLIG